MTFNDFFCRLFGFGNAAHTCSNLRRSNKFMIAYRKWVNTQVYLNWTGPFFKAYHFHKCNIASPNFRVQLIDETSLQGVLLFYDTSIGAQNFAFMFELIKERMLQLGYNLHSSNTRQVRHERYKESIERHVLTPPAADIPGSDLCNQLYGNVHVDFVSVNKCPGYIRLAANTYTDSYFSSPLPFMDLLRNVLQPDEIQN
jgi:hypothetical protein